MSIGNAAADPHTRSARADPAATAAAPHATSRLQDAQSLRIVPPLADANTDPDPEEAYHTPPNRRAHTARRGYIVAPPWRVG